MKSSLLKPGLLVSLHTTIRGGVNYERREIEGERIDQDGASRARWETEREIPDPQEYDRATTARTKARAAVASVCVSSAFGLLCPMSEERELERAIAAARQIARDHNTGARLSYVNVYVLVGRVAATDEEAARAIGNEVRELLEALQNGIKAADADAIREAASKARELGAMLAPEVAGQVSAAIVQARSAARAIVARVTKAGEESARVVQELGIDKIQAARFAFLDLDEGAAPTSEAPAARGIDLPADDQAAGPAMLALPFELEA